MPVTIPENITVHLGPPNSDAPNITVPFPEYAANVASGEIYPTWPESALRANIYAQVSYALNRIYTEWYRSQGYDFDITSTTAYDQTFAEGRDTFDNVTRITNELFNDYLRRPGADEPLFAAFCNGTTVTCDGLSQWGTVPLAEQGSTPYEILTTYYGPNLEIVQDAPISERIPSFQRTLQLADVGEDVRRVQVELNRIARNYPAIPKTPTDGVFNTATFDAVTKFQEVFGLTPDGIVGKATWYRLAYIYVAVKRLAELNSEGEFLLGTPLQFDRLLAEGDNSPRVRIVQYFLAVLSTFYPQIPPVQIDSRFGPTTRQAVEAFERLFGFPQDGVVDKALWDQMARETEHLLETVPPQNFSAGVQPYPGFVLTQGMRNEYVSVLQGYLARISASLGLPSVDITGYYGSATKAAVTAFQQRYGLTPDGVVGPQTWNTLLDIYDDIVSGETTAIGQFPGYTLSENT